MVSTFASIGIAHVVGGTIRVIMWMGSGSIYSDELAPVYLEITGKNSDERKEMCLYVASYNDKYNGTFSNVSSVSGFILYMKFVSVLT